MSLLFRCPHRPNLRREAKHPLPHFLAGLKPYNSAGGNSHILGRIVRIATDARFTQLHLEHPEVSQFNILASHQLVGNVIESFLHDDRYIGLDQSCVVADANNKISFAS